MPLISAIILCLFIVAPSVTALASTTANANATSENQNAREQAAERARKLLENPLGGIIVNRTVTVQGQDFYRYFSAWWREIDQNSHYSISVHERPSARWGSEVWVQYRRDRVFHMFLPPARSQTRDISKMAAEIAFENITKNELQRAIFQSEDLGPEEM